MKDIAQIHPISAFLGYWEKKEYSIILLNNIVRYGFLLVIETRVLVSSSNNLIKKKKKLNFLLVEQTFTTKGTKDMSWIKL